MCSSDLETRQGWVYRLAKNWGAITSFPCESINPTLPGLTTGYRSPPVCAITQIAVVSQTNALHRQLRSVTELDLRSTLTMGTDHVPVFTVARLFVRCRRNGAHADASFVVNTDGAPGEVLSGIQAPAMPNSLSMNVRNRFFHD